MLLFSTQQNKEFQFPNTYVVTTAQWILLNTVTSNINKWWVSWEFKTQKFFFERLIGNVFKLHDK